MSYCPNCGERLDGPTPAYCPKCGIALRTAVVDLRPRRTAVATSAGSAALLLSREEWRDLHTALVASCDDVDVGPDQAERLLALDRKLRSTLPRAWPRPPEPVVVIACDGETDDAEDA